MCGIAGIVRFHEQSDSSDHSSVQAAVKHLSKRGPDYQSVYQKNKFCFGHARLSIIETSALSNQPMEDASGRYVIVYNGELYNFKTLRIELESLGATFNTQSDTEVLLNAYIYFGTSCLQKLNGFFAFAVYDKQDETLFAARDRMGIKPFYYAAGKQEFSFASELKALHPICKEWNLDFEALQLYFELTYVPAPLSMITGIKKLMPGQFVLITKGQVAIENYFELTEKTLSNDDFETAASKVKEHLTRSVSMRMVADVPLGTFLSGGIDSSIISMLASREKSTLETFSLGFKDIPWFDESKYAQVVAHHIGSRHHEIMVSEKELCGHLGEMLETLDEPFADSSALAVFALSKQTSTHVKVALSGDGADELFAGYNKHRALLRSENWPAGNVLLQTASPFFQLFSGSRDNAWSNRFRKLQKYTSTLNLSLNQRYWRLAAWTSEKTVNDLLINKSQQLHFKKEFLKSIENHNLNQLLLADLSLVLPNDMLTKVDRMSMAHGLEVRTPFLDHELVQYVNQLPFSYKANLNQGKLLLRKAFENDLPKVIFTRAKKGFEIPVERWLGSSLQDLLNENTEREFIKKQGLFNQDAIDNLKAQMHSKNSGDSATTLWSLLVFQSWWKNYFSL
jgi:asparagine synthase (glutamine-hydrolysing)